MARDQKVDLSPGDHYAEIERVKGGELPSFSLAMEVVLDLAGQQIPDAEDCDDGLANLADQYDREHTLLSDTLANFAEEIDGIAEETSRQVASPANESSPSAMMTRMIDLASQGVIDDPDMASERRLQMACIKRMRDFVGLYGRKLDGMLVTQETPGP